MKRTAQPIRFGIPAILALTTLIAFVVATPKWLAVAMEFSLTSATLVVLQWLLFAIVGMVAARLQGQSTMLGSALGGSVSAALAPGFVILPSPAGDTLYLLSLFVTVGAAAGTIVGALVTIIMKHVVTQTHP